MREHLHLIKSLHADLVKALDTGDVDSFVSLVGQRDAALAALKVAYVNAPPAERQAIQPDLATLLPLDRDLRGRAGGARDELRAQLDDQRNLAPRAETPVVSGVIDRQA